MYLQLCDLPSEVITDNIFSFLDHKSLVKVSQTCKKLRDCAYTDGNWKVFCQRYWRDTTKERSQESWRLNFIEWYKDMGKYIYVYVPIRLLWDRILDCVSIKSKSIYKTLQFKEPTTEKVLDEIERRLSRPLPTELRCSYRICNGQNLSVSQSREKTQFGLLGVLTVFNYTICEVLLSAESIRKNLLDTNKRSNVVDFTSRLIYVPGHDRRGGQAGFSKRICLQKDGDVMAGNVCIQVDEKDAAVPAFIFAENFTKWLEMLADWLEGRELMVEKGIISQFVHEPTWEAVTEHVKVSVATVLVPEFSSLVRSNPKLMFAYEVTMSMDECIQRKYNYTLRSQHWDVTEYDAESNQRTQAVNESGLNGKHPTMKAGVKFTYTSWTPLTAKGGFMTGHFIFRNNFASDEYIEQILQVECPRFDFRCPEIKNFKFE